MRYAGSTTNGQWRCAGVEPAGTRLARGGRRHVSLRRSLFSPVCLRMAFAMLVVAMLASCGASSGRFRIEGRFRNLNRGEFYVYSPDGGISGRDTITVQDGRFAYEVPLSVPATFVLVFPNFSEQPVFGESGAAVKISGDASHLREMEISGTDDNELMTKFRLAANRLSPPEVKAAAVEFVGEHPQSPVSRYLVTHYFVNAVEPDYNKASELLSAMLKADPDNGRLALYLKQVDILKASATGNRLPRFSATDVNGKAVGGKDLKGKVNVVNTWATWSYDSQNILRWLGRLKKEYGSDLAVVSICIDARPKDCMNWMRRDSITWPNVCDGRMWNTPLLDRFGLATVPGNVIADADGRIVARNLNTSRLREQVEKMLGKRRDK